MSTNNQTKVFRTEHLTAGQQIIDIFNAAGDYPNCFASRRIQDNLSDLQAQVAANAVGGTSRFISICIIFLD